MSFAIGCALCGAGGGKELAIGIAAIFVFMILGSIAVLVGTILNGDFSATETRTRPLEGERAAAKGAEQRV